MTKPRLPDLVWDNTLARIAVRGPDARKFLQGLCTQDLQKLTDGAGTCGFFLEPRGRVLAFTHLAERDGSWQIWMERSALPGLLQHLQRHAMLATVTLEAHTTDAVRVVTAAGAEQLALNADLLNSSETTALMDTQRLVLRDQIWGVTTLWVAAPTLSRELPSVDALDPWRISAGMPRFGIEIQSADLPAETGLLARSVSFTKGCYCGQEVVARQHYRGKPRRVLEPFRSPDPLRVGEAEIAAAAPAPDGNGWVALRWITPHSP